MSVELQARARAFLQRPIPVGIDYAPDSLAERFIATYAARGKLPEDDEASELLELACLESSAISDQFKNEPAASDYFRENASILEAMLAERV